MISILDILERAHNGPVCKVKDWDSKVVPKAIAEKLKKYGLTRTCDPAQPIATDDDLLDRYFQAGYELAHEVGMLCQDTERIVQVSEKELQQSLMNARSQITLGRGLDQVTMYSRRPEDSIKPLYQSPLAIAADEDIWSRLLEGIASNRLIDVLETPSLITAYGQKVLANTPLETLVGSLEVAKRDEVLRKVSRPGMPTVGIQSSTTYHAQLGAFNVGNTFTDVALVLSPFELKTSYSALHKAVQALNAGGLIRSGTPSMIGGYAGPPEGAAVANIASTLLQFPVHSAAFAAGSMMDLRYNGNCGREGLWALGTSTQALARNTNVVISKIVESVCGPGTEAFLYELAAGHIVLTVSGASASTGPRSAGGKVINHLTPLECWYSAAVFKAAAGMTREQGNEILEQLIPKYEKLLPHPPLGGSFQELFDVEKLQPKPEWEAMVGNVTRELAQMGLKVEM